MRLIMQLRNVRIEIDENNVEQYIGEFVFNVELAQDLSSMFTDEDEIHRVIGKVLCDEIKLIV